MNIKQVLYLAVSCTKVAQGIEQPQTKPFVNFHVMKLILKISFASLHHIYLVTMHSVKPKELKRYRAISPAIATVGEQKSIYLTCFVIGLAH